MFSSIGIREYKKKMRKPLIAISATCKQGEHGFSRVSSSCLARTALSPRRVRVRPSVRTYVHPPSAIDSGFRAAFFVSAFAFGETGSGAGRFACS